MSSRKPTTATLLLLAAGAAPASAWQAYDLTGIWQDDVGGRYRIRQVGNTVAWHDDRSPVAVNIFLGVISGNTLHGQWVDLPGGQLQGSGTITLRIESNDRLVKTASSIAYGGSVITRAGSATAAPGPCTIQYVDWNGARQSAGLGEGRDMYYIGPDGARWLARLDRARGVLIHAPNGDFNASHPDDYMAYRNWSNQTIASPKLRDCGVTAAGAGAGGGAGAAPGPCTIQYVDWNGARQSAGLGEGRDMYYIGFDGARWLARLDRARGVLIHAPNGDFNASHPDDYMDYRNWSNQNVASPKLRDCGVTAGGTATGGGAGPGTAPGPCTIQYLDWNGARQSAGLGEGRDMYYLGPNGARWLARLDRARGVLIHAPNGDFNASHPDDYMDYRNWSNQNVASPKLRDCGVTAAGAGAGTAAARPCDDPRTQAAMDQWLAQASPPENQRPGWNVRYDSWGRLVGRTPSTTISGLPQGVDTPLSRCEYLLSIASRLNSSNLGTLQAYLQQRLR